MPHIEDVCERFAAEGFVALAPDLYGGVTTTEPDEAGKEMMALDMDRAATQLSGAVDEVAQRSQRGEVGVVGLCMGGGLALVVACQRPDLVKAVVPFYGLIPWPDAQPDWSRLEAAVQGHYAERDSMFGPEAARSLESDLHALGKDVEFHIHADTDHAFFNDSRPEVHDPEQAAIAWRQTLDFLRAKLA